LIAFYQVFHSETGFCDTGIPDVPSGSGALKATGSEAIPREPRGYRNLSVQYLRRDNVLLLPQGLYPNACW